jgi:uncharacterized protein (DUF2267 family)
MPMPWTYRHASREWRAILDDLKDRMNLVSDNMAYTAMDGVFQVFRRRVDAAAGLAFAAVLPSVPRAIFVAGWAPSDSPEPFADRAALVREAQSVRAQHNLTPDNAIEAVAWALRRHIDPRAWDRAMAALPQDAAAFWHIGGADAEGIVRRIV